MSMPNYEEMAVPIYEAIAVTYCQASKEAVKEAAAECYALIHVYALVQDFTQAQCKRALFQILIDVITKPYYRTATHETVVNRIMEIYELWKGGVYHVDC